MLHELFSLIVSREGGFGHSKRSMSVNCSLTVSFKNKYSWIKVVDSVIQYSHILIKYEEGR